MTVTDNRRHCAIRETLAAIEKRLLSWGSRGAYGKIVFEVENDAGAPHRLLIHESESVKIQPK